MAASEDAMDTIMRLPTEAKSVAVARQLVRDVFLKWGIDEQAEIVLLLTSEVVTNAVVHGGPHRPGAEIQVRVEHLEGRTRVEVSDASRTAPIVGAASLQVESGRGLVLVDTLASTWGVTLTDSGKVVWFEVPR